MARDRRGTPRDGKVAGSGGDDRLPRRLALGGGVAAAVLAVLGVVLSRREEAGGSANQGFGGPFTLTAPDGRAVTDATFHGKYLLVYFGYTYCPDVCPTTLANMAKALDRLGRRADALQAVFITVDPARDTPAVMGQYTSAISPRILGLSGTPAQIATAAGAYHVYYAVHRSGPDDRAYAVDHSSVLYLMSPTGGPLALIPADEDPARMAASIGKYLPAA